jgi:hypothetical protein
MTWLSRLFRRPDRQDDLARELREHLELEVEELRQAGVPGDQALFGARRTLGNTTRIEEEIREMSRWTVIEQLGRDVRYALRLLAKSPSFTMVAILTLALGIGADTAIFSMVNGLLLRPLPYQDPGRLVVPATIFARHKTDRGPVALPDILEWKEQTDLFEAVAAWNPASVVLTGSEEPERVRGLAVDRDYFRVMARAPLLGRTLSAEDNLPGKTRVMVLTWPLWMRRFGGDPAVVGRNVEVNGVQVTCRRKMIMSYLRKVEMSY